MFRLTDIRNIAVQIEENGESAYRKTAAKIEDPELREMFTWMADEEKRHKEWFAALQDDTPVPPEHADLEQMGQSLLKDMLNSQTFSLEKEQLEQTEGIGELLKQAVNFEKDTALFYEFLQSLVSDKEVAKQLKVIIEEERQHAAQLAELTATYA